MKKIIPILLLMCICLASLTGCSLKKENELHGKAQVEAFCEAARTWQSGRYLLTNLDTGEMNQAFSFANNEDGSQDYLYERVTDGNYYAEYSADGEFVIVDGDAVSVAKEGGEGYIAYDTENPHPYATGDLLFYENLFVKSSAENADEKGNVSYVYIYDTEKINEALGTKLSSFTTVYTFDASGNFLHFTQSNSDGENGYSYMIEVLEINSVTEIENPIQ